MIKFDPKRNLFYSTLFPNHISLGFGTRFNGNGKNAEQRQQFLSQNLKDENIFLPNQRHTDKFQIIDIQFNDSVPCDGLITTKSNKTLTVLTADCVPVIYADTKQNIIAISHQGWKGTLNNMAQTMVEAMLQLGSQIENIVVAIGPAAGQCCYDIDTERYLLFKKEYPSFISEIIQDRSQKKYLALNKLNYLQLLKIGLKYNQIDFFPFCTVCNEELFWSYRREGKINGEMIHFISRQR